MSVPPEIVPGLATTGYDACTTASNHSFDRGGAGVDRTLAALDASGVAHAGMARNPEEAARITTVGAGPARVALLSFTYGFNGIPYPDGQLWRANIIDEARILADARRARAAGADVVVVALHWGDEYVHDPNAQQSEMAPRLIASDDIDLLLGHHAHVVQPLENVGGEWVVYGMGNLVATHSTPGAAMRYQHAAADRPGPDARRRASSATPTARAQTCWKGCTKRSSRNRPTATAGRTTPWPHPA